MSFLHPMALLVVPLFSKKTTAVQACHLVREEHGHPKNAEICTKTFGVYVVTVEHPRTLEEFLSSSSSSSSESEPPARAPW